MSDPICPSCDLPISEAAVGAGTCPCCGFRFDCAPAAPESLPSESQVLLPVQALPLPLPQAKPRRIWVPFAACVALAGTAIAGYFMFVGTGEPAVTAATALAAGAPPKEVHAPTRPAPVSPVVPSVVPPTPKPVAEIPLPPAPVAVTPPKPAEKPLLLDPADNPDRKLDAPDGTAEVIELNGDDRFGMTGRVKVLKLNAVNGSVRIDAPDLDVEEIVLTGDINGNCTLKFAARSRVTIRGAVVGSCKLTILAPGGTVTLAEGGRIGGGAIVTLNAKTFDSKGKIDEGARVHATLSAGGSMRIAAMDGGAVVIYRRAAPGDPEPILERGDLRGGTRIVEGK